MAPGQQNENLCDQCGARVPSDRRYCLQCYAPVAGAARAHFESARTIATTHRDDPTIVFSPEKHQQIVRRGRRRKRMIIATATIILLGIAVSITVSMINRNRLAAAKAESRDQAAFRDLNTISDALERFKIDVGRYPTNAEGLAGLVRRPAEFPPDSLEHSYYWLGPYLEHVPEVDPWGDDYVYEARDGGRGFVLFSHGPGGEMGSDGRFQVGSPARDN